jgi:hypothetical protein
MAITIFIYLLPGPVIDFDGAGLLLMTFLPHRFPAPMGRAAINYFKGCARILTLD